MANWRPDFQPEHLYFVTTTAIQHRNLFRRDVMKRLVVDSLDCMRLRHRLSLHAFVVMPNHYISLSGAGPRIHWQGSFAI